MSEDNYLYPKWSETNANIPHDWMRYVTEEVRAIWGDFTINQRIALGRCFEEIASLEEWD